MDNQNIPVKLKHVLDMDQRLRKLIAEYYLALNDLQDPVQSVQLLAEHVTIMVEMMNEIKRRFDAGT